MKATGSLEPSEKQQDTAENASKIADFQHEEESEILGSAGLYTMVLQETYARVDSLEVLQMKRPAIQASVG
ncbi:MAG: hypothetical protein A2Z95_01490 [Gallionellales bacterium GWA2_60_18]|nr:MAG: hypothetical protein A2Z95_01490 [Gallionellales bacterium GWA2_60_18]